MKQPIKFPDVFYDQSLVETRTKSELLADAIAGWACCKVSFRPKSFGETIIKIADKLEMKEPPLCENFIALGYQLYPESVPSPEPLN